MPVTADQMPLIRLTQDLLDRSGLWGHEELPFSVMCEPGHPRVLVIAGENAAGKSLLAQSLTSWAKHHYKIAPISVSIRERTGAGTYEMASLRRVMMFGDESEQSTGATSARVIGTAFRTLADRAESQTAGLLVLDEPELGLSDGYAGAMGTYLASQCQGMPDLACGVAVITHSRELVRAFTRELGQRPTFLKTGEPAQFEHWLEGERARSVEELLALPDIGHERWCKVNAILRELRAQKR